jgi:hypothetical protein
MGRLQRGIVRAAAFAVAGAFAAGAAYAAFVHFDNEAHRCSALMPAFTGAVTTLPNARISNNTTYWLVPQKLDLRALCRSYGDPAGTYFYNDVNHEDTFESGARGLRRPLSTRIVYYRDSGLLEATRNWHAGFASTDAHVAYEFALAWIAKNGGMPPDAVLATSGPHGVFTWRQRRSAGAVYDNRILIDVGNDGIGNAHPNADMYVRVWQTLGAPKTSFVPRVLPTSTAWNSFMSRGRVSVTSQGLCASDPSTAASFATPCREYGVRGRAGWTFLSFATGRGMSGVR